MRGIAVPKVGRESREAIKGKEDWGQKADEWGRAWWRVSPVVCGQRGFQWWTSSPKGWRVCVGLGVRTLTMKIFEHLIGITIFSWTDRMLLCRFFYSHSASLAFPTDTLLKGCCFNPKKIWLADISFIEIFLLYSLWGEKLWNNRYRR